MLEVGKVNISGPLHDANIDSVVDGVLRKQMKTACLLIQGRVKSHTPVGASRPGLRGSVDIDVRKDTRGDWEGRIGTPLVHGSVIEFGRKAPGRMPPTAPIAHWVRRVLGVNDPKQAKGIAFVIARKIAAKGFRMKDGYKMFTKSARETRPAVERILGDNSVKKIVERLD